MNDIEILKCKKPSFTVIGKEGSTEDGEGFIGRLWFDASSHFSEIQSLVKKDEQGKPVGFWGAMSDMSHSFMLWEDNFSRGVYLAGAECHDSAQAPYGWTKWVIPAYEYLYTKVVSPDTFANMIEYLKLGGINLVGAAHDFTCPSTQENYIWFPIKKL